MSTTGPIVFAALFALLFPLEWRRLRSHAAQSPDWREAMRSTPWRDRRRIARAVRRGERLHSPREARLAVGMAEQQQLIIRSMRILPKANLAVGAVFALLGLLAGAATVALVGLVFVALGLAERARERRRQSSLELAVAANREQAALEASQQGK